MALLAEVLIDEWLNRKGYLPMRGVKTWNATVALSKARSIELSLYKERDRMDKTALRKMNRTEGLLAEEDSSKKN